jgi:acetyl esterase/lipase
LRRSRRHWRNPNPVSSAVTHVAKGKGIPPFLILHVADHPDASAQAERLEAVLKDAGIPARRFAARKPTTANLTRISACRTIRRRRRCLSLWMRH